MSNKPALSDLRRLADIISDAVSRIESSLNEKNLDFPALDTPFTRESEASREIPEVHAATNLISSAATQLAVMARAPAMQIIDMSFKGTALKISWEADVAEYLRVHGPSHVNEIARHRNVSPDKLGRVLRVLATTSHVFIETSPNIFANNRLSSLLDSGATLEILVDNRNAKFNGLTAYLDLNMEFGTQAAGYLPRTLLDPKTANSDKVEDAALPASYGFDGSLFEYLELPGKEHHLIRFAAATTSLTVFSNPNAILEGFDWGALPENSLVVDVGGGKGSQSLLLARQFPHLRTVLQDREANIPLAEKFWQEEGMGSELTSGRAKLQAHDFFTPQPIRDASVFYIRAVLLDWPDDACVKILRNLRDVATSTTQLVVQDIIVFHACPAPNTDKFKGGLHAIPPEPILSNWGETNSYPYYLDLVLMNAFHSRTRTLSHWQDILERGGWKLEDLRHGSLPLAMGNNLMIASPSPT